MQRVSVSSTSSSDSSSSRSSNGSSSSEIDPELLDENVALLQTGLKWTVKKYVTAWWQEQISATLCMDLIKKDSLKSGLAALFADGAGVDNRAHGKNVTISIMTKRLKNLVINDGLSKKESLAAAYLCLEIYEDSAPNGLVNSVFTEWCQLLHPSKGGHVRDYFMLQVCMEIIRNSRGVHGSSCEGSSEEEEGGGGAMRRADYTGSDSDASGSVRMTAKAMVPVSDTGSESEFEVKMAIAMVPASDGASESEVEIKMATAMAPVSDGASESEVEIKMAAPMVPVSDGASESEVEVKMASAMVVASSDEDMGASSSSSSSAASSRQNSMNSGPSSEDERMMRPSVVKQIIQEEDEENLTSSSSEEEKKGTSASLDSRVRTASDHESGKKRLKAVVPAKSSSSSSSSDDAEIQELKKEMVAQNWIDHDKAKLEAQLASLEGAAGAVVQDKHHNEEVEVKKEEGVRAKDLIDKMRASSTSSSPSSLSSELAEIRKSIEQENPLGGQVSNNNTGRRIKRVETEEETSVTEGEDNYGRSASTRPPPRPPSRLQNPNQRQQQKGGNNKHYYWESSTLDSDSGTDSGSGNSVELLDNEDIVITPVESRQSSIEARRKKAVSSDSSSPEDEGEVFMAADSKSNTLKPGAKLEGGEKKRDPVSSSSSSSSSSDGDHAENVKIAAAAAAATAKLVSNKSSSSCSSEDEILVPVRPVKKGSSSSSSEDETLPPPKKPLKESSSKLNEELVKTKPGKAGAAAAKENTASFTPIVRKKEDEESTSKPAQNEGEASKIKPDQKRGRNKAQESSSLTSSSSSSSDDEAEKEKSIQPPTPAARKTKPEVDETPRTETDELTELQKAFEVRKQKHLEKQQQKLKPKTSSSSSPSSSEEEYDAKNKPPYMTLREEKDSSSGINKAPLVTFPSVEEKLPSSSSSSSSSSDNDEGGGDLVIKKDDKKRTPVIGLIESKTLESDSFDGELQKEQKPRITVPSSDSSRRSSVSSRSSSDENDQGGRKAEGAAAAAAAANQLSSSGSNSDLEGLINSLRSKVPVAPQSSSSSSDDDETDVDKELIPNVIRVGKPSSEAGSDSSSPSSSRPGGGRPGNQHRPSDASSSLSSVDIKPMKQIKGRKASSSTDSEIVEPVDQGIRDDAYDGDSQDGRGAVPPGAAGVGGTGTQSAVGGPVIVAAGDEEKKPGCMERVFGCCPCYKEKKNKDEDS